MTRPEVPASFYWTDESWGPALRCRALEFGHRQPFESRFGRALRLGQFGRGKGQHEEDGQGESGLHELEPTRRA